MKHLGDKNSRGGHPDRSKTGQAANLVALWKGTRFVIEGGVAIRFDFHNLIGEVMDVPHAHQAAFARSYSTRRAFSNRVEVAQPRPIGLMPRR